MSQIASASASPFTFSFTDPSTGATNAADTSPADFARLSLSAQMAAITADGVNVQAGTSGQLLVGTPADQALFTMANGTVTALAVPSGFEVAPTDIDSLTFEGFPDAVKSAYLAYNGLPANAAIGTGAAPFPAYLASAKAPAFAFTFGGGVDTSLADFEALDAPTRATLVTGYGTDGALLVGTPDDGLAAFTLAADGSVDETREPAGFALLPSAMDVATYSTFTPDERALYLRLNGLGAGSTLGDPAFPAYPAASLSTPFTFLDASDQPSTSLPSFDVLTPALQALAVRQAGGSLLVGAAGNQALFAVDGSGNLTRTAVPHGFALTPAAMDFSTYASFGPAVQALYLAVNGMAATDTLGTAASSFVPSTSGMTSAVWGAMTASQQSDYLVQHGLSRALLSPPSTPAPSGAMTAAQWQALTPAEQTFFAQAYGLSDALTTAPATMTTAAWTDILALGPGPAGVSSQGALYLALNGLDPSLTSAYNSGSVRQAYPSFSAASRQFLARAYGLPDAYAQLPSTMTADAWAQLSQEQKGAYLALTGQATDTVGQATRLDKTLSNFGRSLVGLSADQLAFFLRVTGLPAGFAVAPASMTPAVWSSLTVSERTAYLAVVRNNVSGLKIDKDVLRPAFPLSASQAEGFEDLDSDDRAFVAAINGFPAAFALRPADITAAAWAQLTAVQQRIYLQVNGLSATLATPAANMTSSAYAVLDAASQTFFAAANGLPSAFTTTPSAMTSTVWTGTTFNDAQRSLYLGLNGLASNAATPTSSMTSAAFSAMSATDRAFFVTVNGLPSGYLTAPLDIDQTTFNTFPNGGGNYLALYGASRTASIGTPAFDLSYSGYCTPARSFDILTVDSQSSVDPLINLPQSDRDVENYFPDLNSTGSYIIPSGPYAYGQSNYIYQYGHEDPTNTPTRQTYRLLIGSLGSQTLYTDAATVDAQGDITHHVSHVPVSAAFGFAPSNMDAATFASMPGVEQAAYIAYWHISTGSDGESLVGGAMTLACGQQIDASLLPSDMTAARLAFPSPVVLPPAPYSPASSPALSAADAAAAKNAAKAVTAGQSFHITPYGRAVGPDMLGSTALQATANALYPVQDGTDADSQALVAALSSSDAAAYASAPSAVSAQTFENWPSQVQLAYLHKNQASGNDGVFTIGSIGAQIHVFCGTPANARIAGMVYIAESLTKSDITGMAYADQVRFSSLTGSDGVPGGLGTTLASNLGLTTDVSAVTTLLNNTWTYLTGTAVPGASVMNTDDKNVFIGELNLVTSQLFGLPVPPTPTPGSGAAAGSATTQATQVGAPSSPTGGSAVFSLNDIQTQLTALQNRFKRLAAFELQASNSRNGNYGEADNDVGAIASCNVLSQQEAVIAAAAYSAANLSATATNGSSKDLDLPALICLFEMYAYAGQQAIVKADTEEVNAVNALLQFYAQAQTIVNDCAATTKPNDDSSKVAFTDHADQAPNDASGLAAMMLQNTYLSAIEVLYGVSRSTIDTSSKLPNSYWTSMATNLSSTVTQINQQSPAKMNDITSENKQADRYFDLANTALSKLSDTLQKIAGTS